VEKVVTTFTEEQGKQLEESWQQMHKFVALFKMAGFEYAYPRAIPNEYGARPIAADWFMMATEYGDIKIGWRYRVISIDWAGANIPERNIVQFFRDNVTTWETGVHAWGYKKCLEYLGILKHILMLAPEGFERYLPMCKERWAKEDQAKKEES
jgi:hypothetical protein